METLFSQTEFETQFFRSYCSEQNRFDGKIFNNCRFTACSFKECRFNDCQFIDCEFRGCDMSLSGFKGSSFRETQFIDSKLAGINWSDTNWQKRRLAKAFNFTACQINHSTFFGMNLKNISIHKCSARNVDFTQANLSHADCTLTDFTNSVFLHTVLTEADFSGANNYSIAASLNTLKKTKFSLPDALSLLNELDIILTDAPTSTGY